MTAIATNGSVLLRGVTKSLRSGNGSGEVGRIMDRPPSITPLSAWNGAPAHPYHGLSSWQAILRQRLGTFGASPSSAPCYHASLPSVSSRVIRSVRLLARYGLPTVGFTPRRG